MCRHVTCPSCWCNVTTNETAVLAWWGCSVRFQDYFGGITIFTGDHCAHPRGQGQKSRTGMASEGHGSHKSTELHTTYVECVLTCVLKRKYVKCKLAPGKWCIRSHIFKLKILDIHSCWEGYFCIMFLISVILNKRKARFSMITWKNYIDFYPAEKKHSLKWTQVLILQC